MNLREAMMQPSGFHLCRDTAGLMLDVHLQEPVHFGRNVLRRTELMHKPIRSCWAVGIAFVTALFEPLLERLAELIDDGIGLYVPQKSRVQLLHIAGSRAAADLLQNRTRFPKHRSDLE